MIRSTDHLDMPVAVDREVKFHIKECQIVIFKKNYCNLLSEDLFYL